MSVEEIKRIAVIGAGMLGHGIAQVFAMRGYDVTLLDINYDILKKAIQGIEWSLNKFVEKRRIRKEDAEATLSRIQTTTSYEQAAKDTDFAIEAVPESIDLKKKVFAQIDNFAPKHTILATNTSALSVTEMGSETKRKEKVLRMHWFNPPQLMQLVEVIKGDDTSDETIQTVMELSKKLGKTPIICKKDVRGFIVNRILIPALNEALYLVWEGIADRDDIDKAITLGLNWPMGPLKLLDYLGLDTTLSITEVLQREIDPKYSPCPLLRQMTRAGLLGRKAGKGFYDWEKK